MQTTDPRPFSAATDKFAYAQAFAGPAVRRFPTERRRTTLLLRSLVGSRAHNRPQRSV